MKKIILILGLASFSMTSSATLYKIVCCDNSVHYEMGISEENYKKYVEFSDNAYNSYLDIMATSACGGLNGCVRSIEVVPGSESVAMLDENLSYPRGEKESLPPWMFFKPRGADKIQFKV